MLRFPLFYMFYNKIVIMTWNPSVQAESYFSTVDKLNAAKARSNRETFEKSCKIELEAGRRLVAQDPSSREKVAELYFQRCGRKDKS